MTGPTKGRWTHKAVYGLDDEYWWSVVSHDGDEEICILPRTDANEARDALIAEAFNTQAETGLTPRQLADERGKLWAAAEQALYAIDTVLSSHVGQAEYEELAAAFNALEAALTSSGRAPEGKQDGEDRP